MPNQLSWMEEIIGMNGSGAATLFSQQQSANVWNKAPASRRQYAGSFSGDYAVNVRDRNVVGGEHHGEV